MDFIQSFLSGDEWRMMKLSGINNGYIQEVVAGMDDWRRWFSKDKELIRKGKIFIGNRSPVVFAGNHCANK
jgi:hypothetical protein